MEKKHYNGFQKKKKKKSMSTNISLKYEISIDCFVIGGKKMWNFYLRIVNLSMKNNLFYPFFLFIDGLKAQ